MSENKESRPRAVPGSCRLERRRLLQGAVGATVAMALPGAASAQGAAAKEAPDLARLAADRKLPPLAERLPKSPLVVQVEKAGRYGGTLRRGLRGSSDHNGILKIVGNQGLVR